MPMGGGTPGGSSAGLMLPPNQGAAAQDFASLIQPLVEQAMGGSSPGQLAWPMAQGLTAEQFQNPQQYQALSGAQDIAGTAGPGMRGIADLIMGFGASPLMKANSPLYNEAEGIGRTMAPQLSGAASSILGAGFDPQHALFERTQSQLMDQSNVANAMAGTGSSPYGASTTANALDNFDINWQNNQLNREATAGNAASGLTASAISSLLNPANAGVVAQLQGTSAENNLLSGANSAYGASTQYSSAPYNMVEQMLGNKSGALQNMVNIGNAQYQLPEQLMGDLMGYMGLGQRASQIANQIGSNNFNQGMQTASGIGSLVGGANSLFGGSGGGLLGGSGGLLSAGGLLGSQGPLFGTAADLSIAAGGPPLALEAASAAPFAFSSDRRLKTDIERIGMLPNSLPVYLFRYRGNPERFVGLMADEVEKIHPEAVVTGPDGYKRVYYNLAVR